MKTLLAFCMCLLLMTAGSKPQTHGKVLIRVFKFEKELEVWVESGDTMILSKTYSICRLSGGFGPKRYEGDLQVPEGVYMVNKLNPHSNYYKAVGINYPNKSDSILSTYSRKGGSIYIHGKCVSVGCIAVEDRNIEEIYKIAETSTEITVHIFPARYDSKKLYIASQLADKPHLFDFEENLKEVYEHFNTTKKIPVIDVDDNGKYKIVCCLN